MVDHGLPILTGREKRLLRRIAKGKSNQQIAVEIGGTEQQIGEQRHRLLSKLEIWSQETLTEIANRLAPWPSRSTSVLAKTSGR
jgi:DNA-binding CsgD family transcriptional regulator